MLDVVDVYSGIGGLSCGAMQANCTPILGIDCDDGAVRLWSENTRARGLTATVGRDAIDWPPTRVDLHVHFSPPCTALSIANQKVSAVDKQSGLNEITRNIDLILERGYTSWSFENVSTPSVRRELQRYVDLSPDRIAFTTIDCADFGVPTSRRRLIAGPPLLIRRLTEIPAHRVSVAAAFRAFGAALPANYIKNNSNCIRSVHTQAFAAIASHPLTWCTGDGTTVRCLTVGETAILQGFPREWRLPTAQRKGMRAVGNAIPPPVGAAIMRAAQWQCPEKRAVLR